MLNPTQLSSPIPKFEDWNILLDAGIYTNLILPPAAPGGGAVIRCSVTAAHSAEQIKKIGVCFRSIADELGLSKAA